MLTLFYKMPAEIRLMILRKVPSKNLLDYIQEGQNEPISLLARIVLFERYDEESAVYQNNELKQWTAILGSGQPLPFISNAAEKGDWSRRLAELTTHSKASIDLKVRCANIIAVINNQDNIIEEIHEHALHDIYDSLRGILLTTILPLLNDHSKSAYLKKFQSAAVNNSQLTTSDYQYLTLLAPSVELFSDRKIADIVLADLSRNHHGSLYCFKFLSAVAYQLSPEQIVEVIDWLKKELIVLNRIYNPDASEAAYSAFTALVKRCSETDIEDSIDKQIKSTSYQSRDDQPWMLCKIIAAHAPGCSDKQLHRLIMQLKNYGLVNNKSWKSCDNVINVIQGVLPYCKTPHIDQIHNIICDYTLYDEYRLTYLKPLLDHPDKLSENVMDELLKLSIRLLQPSRNWRVTTYSESFKVLISLCSNQKFKKQDEIFSIFMNVLKRDEVDSQLVILWNFDNYAKVYDSDKTIQIIDYLLELHSKSENLTQANLEVITWLFDHPSLITRLTDEQAELIFKKVLDCENIWYESTLRSLLNFLVNRPSLDISKILPYVKNRLDRATSETNKRTFTLLASSVNRISQIERSLLIHFMIDSLSNDLRFNELIHGFVLYAKYLDASQINAVFNQIKIYDQTIHIFARLTKFIETSDFILAVSKKLTSSQLDEVLVMVKLALGETTLHVVNKTLAWVPKLFPSLNFQQQEIILGLLYAKVNDTDKLKSTQAINSLIKIIPMLDAERLDKLIPYACESRIEFKTLNFIAKTYCSVNPPLNNKSINLSSSKC